MLIVGLTGGIGSGKSRVAQALKEKGAYVFDFDSIAHDVQLPHTPVWRQIVAAFGEGIINADATINRQRLGAVVFAHREKLRELCAIVHPAVIERWQEDVALIALHNPNAIVVGEVPLLFEVKLQRLFDVTVLVHCPHEAQIERVRQRSGLSPEAIMARIDAQLPLAEKAKMADFLIDNGGDFSQTLKTVEDVWERLVRLENTRGGRSNDREKCEDGF